MGKTNVAVNRWLADNERFADLFNGFMFHGKQIIKPEDLENLDREADILITDKSGKTRGVQRYRDIIKRWNVSGNARWGDEGCVTQICAQLLDQSSGCRGD